MASIITRNSHLRRTLLRYTLQRSSFISSPHSPHPPLHPTLSPLPTPVSPLIYQRYFCTGTTTTTTTNTTAAATSTNNKAAAESAEGKSNSEGGSSSGGDESSKGSQQKQTGGGADAGKSIRGSPVSWMSFFLLLVTGAGLVFYYDKEKKRHIEDISNASTAVKEGPSVGQAAIGGPFNLINHEGKSVTEKDFLGKWTVLYFGFTHCPDICPEELVKLSAAIDKIKEKSGIDIVPVFISVDPERDTVEQVSEYVKEFHPKLVGLTGDPEEIRKVARAYRVYYMKTEDEGSDYLVDHSIVMYLMSPEMKYVKFYGKNSDVDGLTNGIIKEVKQYKK